MCYRELLKQATSQEYQTRLQHERVPDAPEVSPPAPSAVDSNSSSA